MLEPVYINEETVKRLLNWDQTYEAIKTALESVPKKRAVQNPRSFTKCTKGDSLLLTMPGYLDNNDFGGLGCKLVTVAPNNGNLEDPLPTINAHIVLFDDYTGTLKAIVAGTEITAWRTAAASVVATKYLTRGKEVNILAILGAGTQGNIHAVAFEHFFSFQEIRIWNRSSPKAQKLVSELNNLYKCEKFKFCQSNEECVRNADVVVTATFAEKPIVQMEWLKEGVHINAVGAGINHHSELSESIYLASYVYVDHWSGAHTELAGLRTLGVDFKGEIGNLISGNLASVPTNAVTVFQSLGMAVEDCAMARLIYELYMKESG